MKFPFSLAITEGSNLEPQYNYKDHNDFQLICVYLVNPNLLMSFLHISSPRSIHLGVRFMFRKENNMLLGCHLFQGE
jgi:hypothetical protein